MGPEHRLNNRAHLRRRSIHSSRSRDRLGTRTQAADIRRDKLFWFGALDSYRRNDPGLSTVRNPTRVLHCARADQRLRRTAQRAARRKPEPGTGTTTSASARRATLLRASSNWPRSSAQRSAPPRNGLALAASIGRPPSAIASRSKASAPDSNAPGGGLTRVSETYGTHSYGSSNASQQWLLARWEAYLTPNLLAVTQGSAGRAILSARPAAPSTFEQSFLSGNSWNQLPQIVVDSRYGFTIGNPSRFGQGSYPDERLYHGQEMLDWAHNKLLVRAGFELDHNADAVTQLRNQTGTYTYSTVAGFISDALAFQKFGFADALDPSNPHNCGATNTNSGSQPCYSYYSQTMGPTDWHLSTNDWAGYATAQWQLNKLAVFSVGLRWEREQMPPPIASLANPELTSPTQTNPRRRSRRICPALATTGVRASASPSEKPADHWPVLRLGYGIYYGRTENATIETALTQTGSLKGDLSFFMRPIRRLPALFRRRAAIPLCVRWSTHQHCQAGGCRLRAPFPYILKFIRPSPRVEQTLPGRVELTAGAMLSLGRRLPVSIDTNFDPAVNPSTITYGVKDPTGTGPIKAAQITVPFYATWPLCELSRTACRSTPPASAAGVNADYQQITQITSRANSTYEAAMVRLARYGSHGLSFHANYTYAHATDWNPNETTLVAGSDVLDPANFSLEYGTSNLDVRHSASVTAIYSAPWKLRGLAGRFANGWMLFGIGHFRSGCPIRCDLRLASRESSTRSGTFDRGLGPGMNGSAETIASTEPAATAAPTTSAVTPSAIPTPGRPTFVSRAASISASAGNWSLSPKASISSITRTSPGSRQTATPSRTAALPAPSRRSATLPSTPVGGASCGTSTITGSELPLRPSVAPSTSTPPIFTANARLNSACACGSRLGRGRSMQSCHDLRLTPHDGRRLRDLQSFGTIVREPSELSMHACPSRSRATRIPCHISLTRASSPCSDRRGRAECGTEACPRRASRRHSHHARSARASFTQAYAP